MMFTFWVFPYIIKIPSCIPGSSKGCVSWMIRGAYTPSLRVQTAPFGRCWYSLNHRWCQILWLVCWMTSVTSQQTVEGWYCTSYWKTCFNRQKKCIHGDEIPGSILYWIITTLVLVHVLKKNSWGKKNWSNKNNTSNPWLGVSIH